MIGMNCDDWNLSSNINEVIRVVLNFLFTFFFYEKISQAQESTKTLNKWTKIKKTPKKYLKERKSPISLVAFLCFLFA